ncbi:hypothetical protein U5640_20830 [Streptomyces sp. SS7]|uniref:effector-associated constant component EACC1 n=1 Tax=Streptomyces sp. SS7 TaxID=3108485 RepID=UPI0030EEE2B6
MSEPYKPSSEIQLSLGGQDIDVLNDTDQLRSLRTWLMLEDPLRGAVTLPAAAPEPGHMGGVVDVLTVAVGSGGAAAVLARSLTTWLIQRRTDVTVTLTGEDGRQVKVDVRRARHPEAVIREVVALTEMPDPPGSADA